RIIIIAVAVRMQRGEIAPAQAPIRGAVQTRAAVRPVVRMLGEIMPRAELMQAGERTRPGATMQARVQKIRGAARMQQAAPMLVETMRPAEPMQPAAETTLEAAMHREERTRVARTAPAQRQPAVALRSRLAKSRRARERPCKRASVATRFEGS